MPHLQEYANIIAHLDAIQSLASVAIKHQLSCPTISANNDVGLVMNPGCGTPWWLNIKAHRLFGTM